MNSKEIGFLLLIGGLAIHVYGNAKKYYDNSTTKTPNTATDYLYYMATLGLLFGVGLLFKEIAPR